jgi:VanZ family protein
MSNFLNRRGGILKDYRLWQWLLATYWLSLFVATHWPKQYLGLPGGNVDKFIHFSAFALLALLAVATWEVAAGRLTPTHLVCMWIVLAVYAALDEGTQRAVGRDASMGDWLADAIGVAAGLLVFVIARRRFA